MYKRFLHSPLLSVLLLCMMTIPAWAQHDEHDDHDHAAHEEHTKHKDSHDDHDDEAIKLDPTMAKKFGITTAQAQAGHIATHLNLTGEVVFDADKMAHVTPAVSGMVSQVLASVGDQVTRGQVLARLSSRELASLRSEWLACKARLELADENATRDERLFQDKVGTERAMLQSRQLAREAQIQFSLAENALHALGFAREQIQQIESENFGLNQYDMIAPIDGVVTQRHLNMGENIAPENKDAAFVIADMRRVWVNLAVYQRDLAKIKAGQHVLLQFGHHLPDAESHITFITPSMDEQTRTLTARVVLDNPNQQWRPGLFVTGKVVVSEKAAAVVVPRSAVVELDQGPVVFVMHDEGFEPIPVKLGEADESHVQILEGLDVGQVYVATNAFALKAQLQKGAFGDGHAH